MSLYTKRRRAQGLCAVCPTPSEGFYCTAHTAHRNALERKRKALARKQDKALLALARAR